MDLNKVNIKPFDGTNYSLWKWQVLAYLEAAGLLRVIEGGAEVAEADEKRFNLVLSQAMVREQLIHVIAIPKGKDKWDRLKTIYESSSEDRVQTLYGELFAMKYESDPDMASFVSHVQNIVVQLTEAGEVVRDPLVMGLILSKLPEKFETFVVSWPSTPAAERTLPNLLGRLLKEEARLKPPTEESSSDVSFTARAKAAKGARGGAGGATGKRFSGKCFNCDKPGHRARDCRQPRKQRPEGSLAAGSGGPAGFSSSGQGQESNKYTWVLDSGATRHICPNREWFQDLKKADAKIKVADGRAMTIKGSGTVVVLAETPKGPVEMPIYDVLLVPDAHCCLFSQSAVEDKGYRVEFKNRKCYVKEGGQVRAVGRRPASLYIMDFMPVLAKALTAEPAGVSLERWHRRLGHVHLRRVAQAVNWKGKIPPSFQCEGCILGKMHRTSFPKKQKRVPASKPGDLVHADLSGQMNTRGHSGAEYFLLLKDDCSGLQVSYSMSSKAHVTVRLQQFLIDWKAMTGRQIRRLRTDNGTEFVNQETEKLLRENRIKHEKTTPHCPEQNGFIERAMRTVVESARSMIHAAGAPLYLWEEAVAYAVHIQNRLPKRDDKRSPWEIVTGQKPSLTHIREFGCPAYVHIRDEQRKKFQAKATRGDTILVGVDAGRKCFRVWDLKKRRIILSRDVGFVEQAESDTNIFLPKDDDESDGSTLHASEAEGDEEDDEDEEQEAEHDSYRTAQDEPATGGYETDVEGPKTKIIQRRMRFTHTRRELDTPVSGRTAGQMKLRDLSRQSYGARGATATGARRQPVTPTSSSASARSKAASPVQTRSATRAAAQQQQLQQQQKTRSKKGESPCKTMFAGTAMTALVEPLTFTEAMESEERDQWIEALEDEIQSLHKNKTWTLVKRQPGMNVIKNKWVFRIKRKGDGSVDRFRARLVAKGFSQKPGIDYEETFAPVARYETIRTLFSLVASEGLQVTQFDVKTAFLYGDLKETLFMEQPEGFSGGENLVCKLQKSLYGLKQSPRQWNQKFVQTMADYGLSPTTADPCVFVSQGGSLIVCCYVDDGLILWRNKKDRDKLVEGLQSRFQISIGDSESYAGLQVKYLEDGSVFLHQSAYLQRVLARFGMEDCIPVSTPSDPLVKLVKPTDACEEELPFRELVGSLMYLAVVTRPDIAYAVSIVSRFMTGYDRSHWTAAKRVLRYLKGTADLGIKFEKTKQMELNAYSDSDYARCEETRRSQTGLVLLLNGGPVVWGSNRQPVVTLSSAEAEFVAASSTVTSVKWILILLTEIGIPLDDVVLFIDNQATIKMIKNPEFHMRTKHIDVRYKYVREKFAEGLFDIEFCPSGDQLADICTKPASAGAFTKIRKQLMTAR